MTKSEYTYTGNMPSGNPFIWYFDETKRTAFATSRDSAYWSRQPKIGDRIVIEQNDFGDIELVYINGQKVFQKTPETQAKQRYDEQRRADAIIKKWRIKK